MCTQHDIFKQYSLWFYFGKFIVLMYGLYMDVSGCYIFIFYFEITKHLGGIFIVFATEVACLFKLFYSELHIFFRIHLFVYTFFFFKKRTWFDTDPFCVNENKKKIRSLLIKENTGMKNRVKIYENCQEGNSFLFGNGIRYTHENKMTRRRKTSREMFLEVFLYCACEKWR